jgi:DNA uptake protein ComE-like DNA-binding protein
MSQVLARRWFVMGLLLVVVALPARVRGQAESGARPLDPNLAGEPELLALPHFTAELAKRVIAGRPYLRMADFDKQLQSLNAQQRREVYGKAFVPLNLNKASREEILMIPGMGDRMLHEFEEYRPYRAMAQFNREIGKYVDQTELQRLARYVFVPVNLNTATDAEILAIPGVGNRMLREFKEYRPYGNIEQFRREIGKYVDEKEVSRLEQYVTLE